MLLARRPESYAEAVAEIEAAGGTAVGISADAADAASLDAAFERIARDLFPGHGLAAAVYNAAGGFARKPFLEQTGAELAGALDGSVCVSPASFFFFFCFFCCSFLPSLLSATRLTTAYLRKITD